MNRRQWIVLLTAAVTAWRWPRSSEAQPSSYVRAVENAFNRHGTAASSRGRIAPEAEPGSPLRIRGRLYRADGLTPMGGALVFAYHTDRTGLYNALGAPHSWRLQGAVRTAQDGTFEFQTIRPASYPDTRIPQHVHVELATDQGYFHAGEWRFADDPLVDAAERAASERAGRFGWVRPVRRAGAGEAIEVNVRVDPARSFS